MGGGVASRRETSGAREVYASQISWTVVIGKRPREEGKVIISFPEAEVGHVTYRHKDTMIIIAEIDGFDVTRVLID